jgi:hypothetical protein
MKGEGKIAEKILECWPDTTRWRTMKKTKKRETEYSGKTHIKSIMESIGLEDGD